MSRQYLLRSLSFLTVQIVQSQTADSLFRLWKFQWCKELFVDLMHPGMLTPKSAFTFTLLQLVDRDVSEEQGTPCSWFPGVGAAVAWG